MAIHRSGGLVKWGVVIATSLLVAACGGTDTTGGGEAGGETGGSTGASTADLDTESTFRYGYAITVSRLDPHKASISQDATTLFPAYDRLLLVSSEGELIPGLAEKWSFSPDGKQLTLNLRQGVTFHDGTPFDAAAVKANVDRAKAVQGSSVATDLRSVTAVTVVDPATVRLDLAQADVALLGALADRAGTQVSPKAIAGGVNLDEVMVGAGPYKLVSHVPGSVTTFERYDGHWDKSPRAKRLEIRVYADSVARLNALRTGQIDATSLSQNQVSEVENDPAVKMTFKTELAYLYVVQNRARAGQDDVKVRQAMLHAIDREGICKAILFGYCEVTDQPFPPGYKAFNPDIPKVLYPYDAEKAKQLLAEAGKKSFSVTMLTPAGLPIFPEVAEAIQAQWKAVGITSSIQPAEPSKLGELMFAQKSADTMLATWGGRPDPSITFAQRGTAAGFANPGGVTTPKMEDLWKRSVAETDPAKREAILREGSKEMAEQVLEMVLAFPKVPYVTNDKVVGFTPYLSSKPEFRTVGLSK